MLDIAAVPAFLLSLPTCRVLFTETSKLVSKSERSHQLGIPDPSIKPGKPTL